MTLPSLEVYNHTLGYLALIEKMADSEAFLLTWGRAAQGQLGHGQKQQEDVPVPTSIESVSGRPISALSCGHFHSAAVIASSVYTWGRGTLGLLGHGDEVDELRPRPVHALAGISVRTVSCGTYQTAAVTHSGELVSKGSRTP